MDVVEQLGELAQQRRCATIVYRKPGEDWRTERLVEPYSLSYSGPNLIVFTWQVTPELDGEAWRNFRTDRIQSVRNSGRLFTPRAAITLGTGEVKRFVMDDDPARAAKSPPSAQEKYFKYIEKAMLDGQMTKRELGHARKLAAALRPEQVKATHAQAYANLLAEVVMDGEVSPTEEELLTNMRVFLGELGWSP